MITADGNAIVSMAAAGLASTTIEPINEKKLKANSIDEAEDEVEINAKANDEDQVQLIEERRLKRKQSLESQVTSGCGGGSKKRRIVDAFYDTLWPILEKAGWKLVSSLINKMTGISERQYGFWLDVSANVHGSFYYCLFGVHCAFRVKLLTLGTDCILPPDTKH